MIPGHMTAVTLATMSTEVEAVAVVGGVMKTARATMIVATANTTEEDTVVDATTSAVAVMTTGGTRVANMPWNRKRLSICPGFYFQIFGLCSLVRLTCCLLC